MNQPVHLTDDELFDATHYRTASAQARAFDLIGCPYRRRPDGTLLVSRAAFDKALHSSAPSPTQPHTSQPAANGLRWSAA